MKTSRKVAQLQIRVSPSEKASIKRAARLAKMDMSEWVMKKLLPMQGSEFGALVTALGKSKQPSLVLAEINDFLSQLTPNSFSNSLDHLPSGVRLEPLLANQLAAMVEFQAAQIGVEQPPWTKEIKPLPEPFFASNLKSLRLHLLTSSPPPFRIRNLFIDSSVGDRV